jgi:3-hydroxyisobutyrate dehydrogenase
LLFLINYQPPHFNCTMHNNITLGFIGIGLMGQPMVLRLLGAGFRVKVWNRSPDKLTTALNAGATPCSSISELTTVSDVILLCLADTPAVEAVVHQGLMNAGSPQKLVIDLSSSHPETTKRLATQVHEHCGMGWVDAPVSGGVGGAEQGNLAIMAGGSVEHVAIARTVLAPLYKQLTHMGAVGCGQITKICNQMIVSCNVLVIAEMMALAQQAGVDAEQIPLALTGGFADSKPLQIVGPQMASHHFEPIKWRVKTLLKDLNMAVDIAKQHSASIPMSGLAAQLMQLHGLNGYLEQDPATLINLFIQPDA